MQQKNGIGPLKIERVSDSLTFQVEKLDDSRIQLKICIKKSSDNSLKQTATEENKDKSNSCIIIREYIMHLLLIIYDSYIMSNKLFC